METQHLKILTIEFAEMRLQEVPLLVVQLELLPIHAHDRAGRGCHVARVAAKFIMKKK